MASEYTANIGLANPAPGDCNWDNDWHRNQYISDVCLGVLNSTNRVLFGGEVSLTGGFGFSISAGSANIAGTVVSWVDTAFLIDAAVPELEYESNWFYVDENGDLQTNTAAPSGGSFAALVVVDVDDTAILQYFDIRALQADASIIPAIEKILSGTGIVDVKIGSVKNDSDLGLWVEKAAWASWYNEPLNTATRGAKRKFPKDYLIIGKIATVTIYDLTDASVPMWMVFDVAEENMAYTFGKDVKAISMLEGILCLCTLGLVAIDFKKDKGLLHYFNFVYLYDFPISGRHSGTVYDTTTSLTPIVNQFTNDVSMTVLSGNNYPTIAVATEGGVSVIDGPAGKDTVINLTWIEESNADSGAVSFSKEGGVYWTSRKIDVRGYGYLLGMHVIPSVDVATEPDVTYRTDGTGDLTYFGVAGWINTAIDTAIGGIEGLTATKENTATPQNGMVNIVTDKYQSGWMHGDIKLATLADTTAETIGVDVTTNHITNGDFSSGVTGWDAVNGAILADVGGTLSTANGASGRSFGAQTFTTIAGQIYNLAWDAVAGDGATCYTLVDGVLLDQPNVGTLGNLYTFKAATTSTTISFGPGVTSVGAFITVDNVSVKAVQNLVQNGEFAANMSWTFAGSGIGASTSITGGQLVVDGTQTSTIYIVQPVVEAEKWYSWVCDVAEISASTLNVWCGAAASGLSVSANLVVGVNRGKILCSPAGGNIQLTGSSDSIFKVNSFELYDLDVPDRSYNNNPLQIAGQLTKTAVAADAELVAYSGFTFSDYIQQPYNAELSFGTSAFSVSCWVKLPAYSSSEYVAHLDVPGGATTYFILGRLDATTIRFQVASGSGGALASAIVPINQWFHVVGVREAGNLKIYLNGTFIQSSPEVVPNQAFNVTANHVLNIGKTVEGGNYLKGSVALFRVSSTAPTADQIKEIYQAEKRMFTEGAEITLTETEVKCLSYDEDSDTLKIGVTDGANSHHVDTFSGSVKIDSVSLSTVPVAIDHNFNSKAVGEGSQIAFNKDSVNLREL